MGRPVGIVPHTHWDREWHEPYQVFRARLVRLLDELLALLERDRSYARFLLDGQTVVVDDYLEVRPEAEDAIRRLVAEGRLSLGPWMVLMDELMVSGETIVRDLQLGTARAAELGGAMPVGYLPDMFGHVAQMPQILRLAGLDHAVVWRGVPSEIDRTAFWWEAPDGSRVRAEYLYGSYSNGRDLPDDAVALVARARGYEHELGPVALPGGGLLLMNGTDHQLPQPWLGRVVTEANALQDDYELAVTSLPEYLAAQPVDGLPTWRGELRSGARANVLMGVASNRVDVHRAAAAAERAIERRAEPLTALFASDDTAARRLLGQAWRRLVENSAHDSSCACSHDDVVDQVVVRYREARQIGDVLTRDALHRLAAEVDAPPGSTVVVNPTAADRGGLVEVRVPGEGPVHLRDLDGGPCPAQVVATGGGEGFHAMVEGRKIRWVLDTMRGPELAGTTVTSYEVGRDADGRVDVRLQGAGPGDEPVDLEGLREELMALGEAGASFRVRLEHAPSRVVVFVAPPVPGFGWRTFVPVEGDGPSTAVSAGPEAGGGVRLDNERLAVTVDPDDGTITLVTRDGVRVEGANRYVDGGDGGDTYNYSPPDADVLVDRPESVTARVTEVGPVRARALVEAVYRWPTHAIGDERSCRRRSEETAPVTVRTTLELRAGEPFLRVRCELDNVCRDHRLRAHFPLPARRRVRRRVRLRGRAPRPERRGWTP
ncbi:MAG: alpha-mannosidase [Acidimicrobiia bacterium]|nr:alpha-mannosidase [Acidimicrobiia bacterium]